MVLVGVWEKVAAENLVRHRCGTYYLQAKVRGKPIRKSLKTDKLRIAKMKRDSLLKAMRSASVAEPSQVRTLGDALALVAARYEATTSYRPRTRAFYAEVVGALRKTMPCSVPGGAWTRDAASRWWEAYSTARSPEQANKGLAVARKMTRVLIEAGIRHDDPTKGLKRMSVPSSAVEDLPPMDKVLEVVASIRAQRKRSSEEAASMVEFLLWSGLRKGELQSLTWERVGNDWLDVDGKRGRRRVPISEPLRAILDRMRYEGASGPVFHLKSPYQALRNACRRVGVQHLRIHDLRHLFATHCIESGVDIPTVAKWLGHKDGGALAMQTYGHIRDEHSLEQIRRIG